MSKQDGYSSRTAVDLERKYNFGRTFAEVYGLISDAQRTAQEAQNAFDGLNHDQIFNLLTDYGKQQGIYRDDNGDVYVNASYIKGGKILANNVEVEAAAITGSLTVGGGVLPSDLAVKGDIPTDVAELQNSLGYVQESNMTTIVGGIVTTDYVNALGISVNAAKITGTLTVGQLPSSVATTGDIPTKVSELTNDKKYQTETGVTNIVEGVVTTDYLYALGVSATNLRGETVLLKDEDDDISGGLEIRSASMAGYAVDLWSYGSLSVDAVGGSLYLGAEDGYIAIEEVDDYGYQISCGVDVIPSIPGGSLDLGHYYYQWGNIYSTQTYAAAAEADTSDRNKKNSISYDLTAYDSFFDRLQPAIYKLNNGTSGRYHVGMIAQDVEQALADSNIPTSDFAGFIKIEDSYALRYGEFIALLIRQVQQLKGRVAELEGKIA